MSVKSAAILLLRKLVVFWPPRLLAEKLCDCCWPRRAWGRFLLVVFWQLHMDLTYLCRESNCRNILNNLECYVCQICSNVAAEILKIPKNDPELRIAPTHPIVVMVPFIVSGQLASLLYFFTLFPFSFLLFCVDSLESAVSARDT